MEQHINMSTNKSDLSFFNDTNYHAFTALEKAHFISFAPFAFQASVLLRDYGILQHLQEQSSGLSFESIQAKANVSAYGVRILLEAGIGIGLLSEHDALYYITKTGSFFITDAMVKVNTNFMRDICYEGAGKLKESIEEGAEAFAECRVELDPIYANGLYYGFIECGKSKWFQAEKIKAQIEENLSVLEMLKTHGTESSIFRVKMRIEGLEKELKELE